MEGSYSGPKNREEISLAECLRLFECRIIRSDFKLNYYIYFIII